MTNTNAHTTDNHPWFKSSYSEGSGNACVEVAFADLSAVLIRDSKDISVPHFQVSSNAWAAFVGHASA